MCISSFILCSSLCSNLCNLLYYFTTPCLCAGDPAPVSVLSSGVLDGFCLFLPLYQQLHIGACWFCMHVTISSSSLLLQWKLGIWVPFLLVLLPSHATKVPCFSCHAWSSVSVPELAQLLFLKLGALLAASFSSQSSHTRSQGTECSTLTCWT